MSSIGQRQYATNKKIDQQSKDMAEQKKRDEKKERFKGITGGGFGNRRFSFGNSDSDRHRCKKKKKKKKKKHSRRRFKSMH